MSPGAARYPLVFDERRAYPVDFSGAVHVWDIDKTYLSTHFSSTKGLLRIPVEFAVDKRAIPGMPEVLRGLRRGAAGGFACVPIYFVSASPPQLRRVLERKMLLDGVEHDGTVLKDWVRVVAGWSTWRLREQVGFKLCALLTARRSRPRSVEYLYGDDTEADALAFTLYAALVAGELTGPSIDAELAKANVASADIACVRRLVDQAMPFPGGVARVFIHLEHNRLSEMAAYPLVTAVRDGLQMALAVYGAGLVLPATVSAAALAVRAVQPAAAVANSVADAVRRGLVRDEQVAALQL